LNQQSIDKQAGRACNSQALGFCTFLAHFVSILARVQALVELVRIKLQLGGKPFQIILTEGAGVFGPLLFKKLIIVIPKTILLIRAL
jgi:hypothetical protein